MKQFPNKLLVDFYFLKIWEGILGENADEIFGRFSKKVSEKIAEEFLERFSKGRFGDFFEEV